MSSLQVAFCHQTRHGHDDDECDDPEHHSVDDVAAQCRHGRYSGRRETERDLADDWQCILLVETTEVRYDGRQDHQQQLGRYRYLQLLPEPLVDVLLATHAHTLFTRNSAVTSWMFCMLKHPRNKM